MSKAVRLALGLLLVSFVLVGAGCGAKEDKPPEPAATDLAPKTADKGTPKVSPSPPANLNPGFKDPIGSKGGG